MVPHHMHWRVEDGCNAGAPPACIFGEPPFHGKVVTGMQGMGVSTPKAAAVAAATCGLAGDAQTPKGEMLTSGAMSYTFAARVGGRTFRTPGVPNEQLQPSTAPEVTIGSAFAGCANALAMPMVGPRRVSTGGAVAAQVGTPFGPIRGMLPFFHALTNRPGIADLR
jgi:hypothetical protein